MKRIRNRYKQRKEVFAKELLLEIDLTLEQLIKNAELFQGVEISELSNIEIEAFQKTQESLLQHFIFMDQALETKRKGLANPDKRSAQYKIQEKASRFEKLKKEINLTIQEARKKESFFSKRKRKRYLNLSK